jgi:hypothetical protein
MTGAVGTAATRRRFEVVELAAQIRHEASVGRGVVQPGGLLGLAGGRDPQVTLGVIGPSGVSAFPALGDPADRTFDVQDLEHQLEPRAAQVGDLLQQPGR